MEIDWGDPKSVTLLGLDALTILILAVQGLRHWKQCSRRLSHHNWLSLRERQGLQGACSQDLQDAGQLLDSRPC